MSKLSEEERREFLEEMRQDALEEQYHDARYEARMRDHDDDLFWETVAELADVPLGEAFDKLRELCDTYGRDYHDEKDALLDWVS